MALSKKTVGIIIALIIISLTGLVIMQISLLGSAMELKEQSFKNNVSNALSTVSEMIETQTIMISAYGVACDEADSINVIADFSGDSGPDSIHPRVMIISSDTVMRQIDILIEDSAINEIASPTIIDSLCMDNSRLIKKFRLDKSSDVNVKHLNLDTAQYIFRVKSESDSVRVDFLNKVLEQIWVADTVPIENRLDSTFLDSILKNSIENANIEQDYVYAVEIEINDSLIYSNTTEYKNELKKSEFKARLFPFDLLGPQVNLLIFFPDRQIFIWKEMGPLLISTIIFILIIIFCFIMTIKTIFSQKRNASLMVDFINNMTHEFKTPISTVALATEAILRPDVISDNDKVTRFSSMIIDENRRMRKQTEKILQMAAIEEGDYELKLTKVDIHELIENAVENIALHIENRHGNISCLLNAKNHILMADKVHMGNVIYNLLDNANKYSPESPKIKVSTWDGDNGIYVRVEDNGVGIKKEHQKMVFDKYFRVSSGNTHDVKGFGLGLSYVKLMVKAHNGEVSLESTPGQGTRIELFSPIQSNEA